MKCTFEILYSGKVQKVGFRAYVKNIGKTLGLTGDVRNLEDGRVRVLVTVDDEIMIDKFMSMISCCPTAIIRNVSVSKFVLTEFQDFNISM